MADDTKIEVYSIGLVNASVCCPKDMPIEEITRQLNASYPTGLDHGWALSEETHFATGAEHPKPCENLGETRVHRLFNC